MRILASKTSMKSAMKLRDSIEDVLGMRRKTILVSHNSEACMEDRVLLRYGAAFGNLGAGEPEWGKRSFSEICVNKLTTSALLRGVVNVPDFISDSFPSDFPVLIRETLTGCQSNGIHIIHNPAEFLGGWMEGFFWTKYFTHTIELRVYAVFLDNEICYKIYKKVPRDSVEGAVGEFINGIDGSDNTSWVAKSNTLYPLVITVLAKMSPIIRENGGKFIGIDMIYVPAISDYVVLEMNSGPWLPVRVARWLAEIVVRECGLEALC